MRPTDAAVACRLVQLRAALLRSENIASATSRPVRFRPIALAWPAFMPAKPVMPAAPTVSMRVCTTSPPSSVTVWSLRVTARLPVRRTNS